LCSSVPHSVHGLTCCLFPSGAHSLAPWHLYALTLHFEDAAAPSTAFSDHSTDRRHGKHVLLPETAMACLANSGLGCTRASASWVCSHGGATGGRGGGVKPPQQQGPGDWGCHGERGHGGCVLWPAAWQLLSCLHSTVHWTCACVHSCQRGLVLGGQRLLGGVCVCRAVRLGSCPAQHAVVCHVWGWWCRMSPCVCWHCMPDQHVGPSSSWQQRPCNCPHVMVSALCVCGCVLWAARVHVLQQYAMMQRRG